MNNFYSKGIENIFTELNTSKKGLSSEEAKRRLMQYGFNEIKESKKISPLILFLLQFNNPLIGILISAAIISALIGEATDALIIGFILVLNALIGFVQEYKAEKAIEALKKMASLKAVVIRDGAEKMVNAKELVPGDIILLDAGQKIPADSRVIECIDLKTQEATLTGESIPINKNSEIHHLSSYSSSSHSSASSPEFVPVAEQHNMVFSDTIIVNGKGLAVVCSTGMNTEIGKIANMIQSVKPEPTPMQNKLKILGKWIGILTIIICAIIFFAGIAKGKPVLEFFIIAVSLAVAAIPEGLPAVVTISLALGVRKMVKKNALVRNLPSVETLGCTTVICSDKTGTLTHNEMTIKKIFVDDNLINVSGSGYRPDGEFSQKTPNLNLLLEIGALNNNAKIDEQNWSIIGDPTEGALLVSAMKAGLDYRILGLKHRRIGEIPFTSERKMMTTIHEKEGKKYVYVKGAVDIILEKCAHIKIGEKIEKMDRGIKSAILEKNDLFSSSALRVLGFAYKEVERDFDIKKAENKELLEKDLIFVGLQGMIDPPRDEAKESIRKCITAGIKVVMITGDHKNTAMAIAKELGIAGKAITGKQLEAIDLDKYVGEIGVYARVDPKHKLRIVEALKKRGHIVAMTGDGVNDAPALKKADIGIAMGITGTDVSKEASSIILLDDNFSSIVNAVEEGRTIFENIKIFVKYLLIGNVAGILAVFISVMFGFPLPLLALQILWFNLVTETIPAVALTKEPPEADTMAKKPRNPKESFVNKRDLLEMGISGLIITLGVLGIFYYALKSKGWNFGQIISMNSLPEYYMYATTMAFTALVFFQIFNVFNMKSPKNSIFFEEIFNNKWLLCAVGLSVLLQLVAIYSPLSRFFSTVPLTGMDWIIILSVSSSLILFDEIFKLAKRLNEKNINDQLNQ